MSLKNLVRHNDKQESHNPFLSIVCTVTWSLLEIEVGIYPSMHVQYPSPVAFGR